MMGGTVFFFFSFKSLFEQKSIGIWQRQTRSDQNYSVEELSKQKSEGGNHKGKDW